MHDCLPLLRATAFPPLRRRGLAALQVSLGYRCNQQLGLALHDQGRAGAQRHLSDLLAGDFADGGASMGKSRFRWRSDRSPPCRAGARSGR